MASERTPILGHDGNARRSSGSRGWRSEAWVERPGSGDSLALSNLTVNMKHYAKEFFSVKNIKSKFPITKWLPQYSLYNLQCDVISGLSVALTVLPQGLAYATIANLPQQYGLYSAFMGCFVYTIFGTSKDITLGPTAIMSLMTAAFATSPIDNDPTYAIMLTLVCGVVQFLMGVFHLGILVNFISYPVINAFTSAAAITIACGQIKGILGLKDIPREFLHMVYETCKHIPDTNVWDLTLGIVCIIILLILKQVRKIKWKDNADGSPLSLGTRIFRKIVWLIGIGANAIIVISAAGVVAILTYNGIDKLSKTGDVKKGLPPFQPPKFSVHSGNTTISTATLFGDIGAGLIIVPLLGLLESIAIGKAFARQNKYKILPNQELLAIGIANLLSSFVSSYPITGSFSRTAVNSQSGVRTPAGGIVTGLIILLSLQFLTPLFYYIPKAALSAVIIAAVIQMVDYEILPKFWKLNKIALVPWFFTFVMSFVLGIEYGILIGIGIHLLILLYPMARPPVTFQRLFSEKPDESYTQILEQTEYLECVVVTFKQNISFPSSEYLQQKVLKGMAHESGEAKSVVLDCSYVTTSFDYTSLQSLGELIADFKANNVHFALACVQPEIKYELIRADVKEVIFADTVDEAIRKVKAEMKKHESDDPETVVVTKDSFDTSSPSINRTPNSSPNGSPVTGAYGAFNQGFELDKPGERL